MSRRGVYTGLEDMTRRAQRIADNLKRARAAAGLTQQALAEEARVAVVTISRIEQGRTNQPREDEFGRIAAVLKTTTDALLGILDIGDDDDPDAADDFRAQLAHRYGPENAAFVDEVATKIKDFPARDAALVRTLLLGAVRAADPRPRNSQGGASEIGNLVRAQ